MGNPGLKGKFCPKPFERFELQENGSVYLCCPGWLPRPAGNLNSDSAARIWNSDQAQAIRRSILDGDFSYCNKALCPEIQARSLPTRNEASKTRCPYRKLHPDV